MSRPVGFRNALLAVLAGFLAFLVTNLCARPEFRAFFSPAFLAEWFRVGEVMRIASTRYVDADKVTFEKLGRAADTGAVEGLDRYSEFLDTPAFVEQNRRTEQILTGIGISLQTVDGLVTIRKVFEGGGAEVAGLKPGDRIVGADGRDLTADIGDPTASLRGEEGTTVKLRIVRRGVPAPFELSAVRRAMTVPTVSEIRMLPDGVTGYLFPEHFERRTAVEVGDAIRKLTARGARRFVLDLRGNPGGLVDSAVDIVGLFVPGRSLVVSLVGRTEDVSEKYVTRSAPAFPTVPLVVLVDGNSASSSEIVAGALKDYGRAVIVGSNTYGKGIVQSVYHLDDKTGLKLTTARYTLPKGSSIHGKGVTPDIRVEESPEHRSRRFVEEGLVTLAGGPVAFEKRFGYAPAEDEALTIAMNLFASGTR